MDSSSPATSMSQFFDGSQNVQAGNAPIIMHHSSCNCPGEDQNIDFPAIMESIIASIIYAIGWFLVTRLWYILIPRANKLYQTILVKSYLRLRTFSKVAPASPEIEEKAESQEVTKKRTLSKSVIVDFDGKDFDDHSSNSVI